MNGVKARAMMMGMIVAFATTPMFAMGGFPVAEVIGTGASGFDLYCRIMDAETFFER